MKSAKDIKIRTKILTGVVVVMLVGAAVVTVFAHQSHSSGLDDSGESATAHGLGAWDRIQTLEVSKLTAAGRAVMANTEWQRMFAARQKDALTKSTTPVFEDLKSANDITHWYFEQEDGTCFLRVHKPEQAGDKIERSSFKKAVETGETGAGLDLGKTAIALRAVMPYRSATGAKLGYVEMGQEVDEFVDAMKEQTGDDYFLLLTKDKMDQQGYADMRKTAGKSDNWADREEYVLAAGTNEELEGQVIFNVPASDVPETGKLVGIKNGACARTCHDALGEDGDYWAVRWSDNNKSTAHGVFPVQDVNGEAIGIVYSISDISLEADAAKNAMISTLTVILITLILATVVIGGVLDTQVFRRLNAMIQSMEELSLRIAGGDFDAKFIPDEGNDEIAQFEHFFAKFMTLVSNTLKSLTKR